MTKEQIFTVIQNVVSNNPVLVIGSGASMPYHIPGAEKEVSPQDTQQEAGLHP